MTRKLPTQIGPALILALGIIASSLVTALASGSPWLVGAGVLVAAVSILGADVLDVWLRRQSLIPSLNGIVAVTALLLACGIVAIRDPKLVSMLIPVLGGGSASAILFKGQSRACARRSH